MARKITKSKRARVKAQALPFTTENYILFGISFVVLMAGYISLSKGPADSFWSLTLAPILLVIGYCVLIPLAIMYNKKESKAEKK